MAQPDRLIPGELKNQPRLGESEFFETQRRRNEAVSAAAQRTRDFVLSKPVIDTSKSLYNYAQTVANSGVRFFFTGFKMLEEADNSYPKLAWKMNTDPAWMKKALDVWNSQDAKEYRFHVLDNFQHMGRVMYAAGKITLPEMKAYAANPSNPVRVAAGISYRYPELWSRFRELCESPEAGRWVAQHGHLFVDLPVGLLLDTFANPLFAIAGSVRSAKHFGYIREAVNRAREQRTVFAARHALLPGSGMGIPMEVAELVKDAPTAEHAVRFLHVNGYREPGVLDKLGIKWFRRADTGYSAAENEHILQNASRLRQADKATRDSIEGSKELMKFVDEATSQEIFDWTNLIQDEKNLSEYTAKVIAGDLPPISEATHKAVIEYQKITSMDRIVRGKHWATDANVLLRNARVEKKLADANAGRITWAEYRTYAERQAADAPPTLEWYWKKIGSEAQAGEPIPKWRARIKREQEWKKVFTSGPGGVPRTPEQLLVESDYLANYTTLEARGKLRSQWTKSIGSLSTQAGREMTEASWLKMVKDLDSEIIRVTNEAPAVFGGAAHKARVLDGLGDLKKMATKAGEKAEHRNDFVALVDVVSRSARQMKIFFPFTHYLENNAINNVGKNLMVRGMKDYTNPAPRFSVLGEELDFVGSMVPTRDMFSGNLSHLEIRGRQIYGLLDVPGLETYRNALNTLNSPIEFWTRNPLGWGVYRDTVRAADDAARAAGRELSAKALDDLGRNAAVETVARTQFVPYHAPAITLAERVMPGSFFGFRAQDMLFSARYALEHPAAAASFMRGKEEIEKASVRGDGMLKFPGTDHVMDPLDGLPLVNSISLMQRTRSPEIGESIPDTAIRVARSLDSALTNLSQTPRHLTMPAEILANKFAPGQMDEEGVRRRDAKAMMSFVRESAPGLDRSYQAVTGKHIYEEIPGEAGKDVQRVHEERVKRGGVLVQRVWQLRGQAPPDSKSAEELWLQAERDQTKMDVLGFKARYDPDGAWTAVRQSQRWYYELPGKQARENEYEKWKVTGPNGPENYFEGLVTRPEFVPQSNPDKRRLDDYNRAAPEQKQRMYLDSTRDQQKGMLREFFEDTWKVIQNLRSEIRSNIGVGTAEAAEPFDVPKDTFPNEANVQRYVRALPREQKEGIGGIRSIMLDVGVPSKYGKSIIWTNHDLPNLTAEDRKNLHEIDFRMNAGTNAILTMFQQGDSKEAMRTVFQMKEVPIVNSSGKADTISMSQFINPNKPIAESRLYRTFQHAVDQGLRRSTLGDPDNELVTYTARVKDVREAMQFMATDTVPGWKAQQWAEKRRAQEYEIQPGIELLKKAAYHPNDYPPFQVDRQIQESIASGKPGALPKDFWDRVKGVGEYALLADYGVSMLEARAAPVYSLIHRRTPEGRVELSEPMVDHYLARGREPELRALAQRDNELRSVLQIKGIPVDAGTLHDDGLSLIAQARGYTWTNQDVDLSIGVVPRSLVARSAMDEPGPISFDTTRPPLLPPQAQRETRTPTNYKIQPQQMLSQSIRPFHSVSEYVRYSARDAMLVNESVAGSERSDGVPSGTYGRVSVFDSARNNLSMLPPTAAARGAAGVMQFGYALGFVGYDDVRTIYRGINQADMVGMGADAAETVLALAGNTTAALSSAEQYARLSSPTISKAVATNLDGTTRFETTANPNYSPAYAGLAKYGSAGGALLSFGSGVANQAGAPEEVSIGLGAGGGALQGAAAGTQILPGWGTLIGAILGGAMGGFLGQSQKDDREERFSANRELQKKELEQRIAFSAERQREFRVDTDLRRGAQSRQALAQAFNERQGGFQSRTSPAGQRLTQFLRRPTYTSSQGLARDVDRFVASNLRPRY